MVRMLSYIRTIEYPSNQVWKRTRICLPDVRLLNIIPFAVPKTPLRCYNIRHLLLLDPVEMVHPIYRMVIVVSNKVNTYYHNWQSEYQWQPIPEEGTFPVQFHQWLITFVKTHPKGTLEILMIPQEDIYDYGLRPRGYNFFVLTDNRVITNLYGDPICMTAQTWLRQTPIYGLSIKLNCHDDMLDPIEGVLAYLKRSFPYTPRSFSPQLGGGSTITGICYPRGTTNYFDNWNEMSTRPLDSDKVFEAFIEMSRFLN